MRRSLKDEEKEEGRIRKKCLEEFIIIQCVISSFIVRESLEDCGESTLTITSRVQKYL